MAKRTIRVVSNETVYHRNGRVRPGTPFNVEVEDGTPLPPHLIPFEEAEVVKHVDPAPQALSDFARQQNATTLVDALKEASERVRRTGAAAPAAPSEPAPPAPPAAPPASSLLD